MPLTPEQRRIRASVAAHARWSQEDPAANAQRGQADESRGAGQAFGHRAPPRASKRDAGVTKMDKMWSRADEPCSESGMRKRTEKKKGPQPLLVEAPARRMDERR